jgi:hypothetical protein
LNGELKTSGTVFFVARGFTLFAVFAFDVLAGAFVAADDLSFAVTTFLDDAFASAGAELVGTDPSR